MLLSANVAIRPREIGYVEESREQHSEILSHFDIILLLLLIASSPRTYLQGLYGWIRAAVSFSYG